MQHLDFSQKLICSSENGRGTNGIDAPFLDKWSPPSFGSMATFCQLRVDVSESRVKSA